MNRTCQGRFLSGFNGDPPRKLHFTTTERRGARRQHKTAKSRHCNNARHATTSLIASSIPPASLTIDKLGKPRPKPITPPRQASNPKQAKQQCHHAANPSLNPSSPRRPPSTKSTTHCTSFTTETRTSTGAQNGSSSSLSCGEIRGSSRSKLKKLNG